jgi:hypothetical protein
MSKQGNLPDANPTTRSLVEMPRYEPPSVSQRKQLEILQVVSGQVGTGGRFTPGGGGYIGTP